ncbi:hypothetical protein D3C73_1452480 [compost metagenome]
MTCLTHHLLLQPVPGYGQRLHTVLNKLQIIPILRAGLFLAGGIQFLGHMQQITDGTVHPPAAEHG